jgi:hypothetical protein
MQIAPASKEEFLSLPCLKASAEARPTPNEEDRHHSAPQGALKRRATETLQCLLDQYEASPGPIEVSFRRLVGPIPVNYLSHSIYPYPARLLRQIPRFFLHCRQIASENDVVLDPFCGSGTVLVEARAAHLTGWGIDSNPFARLLSEVKTTPLDAGRAQQAAGEVLRQAKAFRSAAIPDVVNVDFWFSHPVKQALGRLRRAILESGVSADLQRFLLVSLALAAERCSLRDARIPVPVRRHGWATVAATQNSTAVWQMFAAVSSFIAARLAEVPSPPGVVSIVEGRDAATAYTIYRDHLRTRLQRPTVILTSPPYGAAQKYIRSTSLALGWTNLASASELAALERLLIGREHLRQSELSDLDTPLPCIRAEIDRLARRDKVRAAIYAHYFRAMGTVIENLVSLLAPGGVFVLVAGSNAVAGEELQTHHHLRDLAVANGMTPVLELRDAIRGRVLLTKRASANAPLKAETVHVLRKAP